MTFSEISDREREVLTLVAQGLLNQEIADRLDTSLQATRYHVSNILSELQVADRHVAAERARTARPGRDST